MNRETMLSAEVFVKKQTLLLFGAVDDTMLDYVSKAMLDLSVRGCPPIHIIINSGGGEVKEGLHIYDLLRAYQGRKIGIVVNNAASMAAVILQACDERYATKYSCILIHNIRKRLTLDEIRNKRKFRQIYQDLEKLQSYIYEILFRRTGNSLATIRKECAKDKPMYMEDAKKLKLIDDVWEKPLPNNLPYKEPDKPLSMEPTG